MWLIYYIKKVSWRDSIVRAFKCVSVCLSVQLKKLFQLSQKWIIVVSLPQPLFCRRRRSHTRDLLLANSTQIIVCVFHSTRSSQFVIVFASYPCMPTTRIAYCFPISFIWSARYFSFNLSVYFQFCFIFSFLTSTVCNKFDMMMTSDIFEWTYLMLFGDFFLSFS